MSPARADDGDGIFLEYSHYEEGHRDLGLQTYKELNLKPVQDDSAALTFKAGVIDDLSLTLDYSQDTWSGATPVTTVPEAAIADQIYTGASRPLEFYADSHHKPVAVDWDSYDGTTVRYATDTRLVHVMASASPETRRQIDFTLGYAGDDMKTLIGAGLSIEPDYQSRFASFSQAVDLDDKRTTVSAGLSFTQSDIRASLDANAAADWGAYPDQVRFYRGASTLFGSRRDWSFNAGLTRVLNKSMLLSSNVGLTRSSGYLSNPYKAAVFAFDDPDQFVDSTGLRFVVLHGVLEKRPDLRNQLSWSTKLVAYIEPLSAALHAEYTLFRDDWGITAHTLDASLYQPLGEDWMLVPGLRFYTQSKADFYAPYFSFDQAFPIKFPRNPELPPQLDFSQVALQHYSSDERLSAFGTVSGRLAVDRTLWHGAILELGAEYSLHAGALSLQGRGEGSYADFTSYSVHAQLRIDQAAQSMFEPLDGSGDSGDATPMADGTTVPAGVGGPRMLHKEGQFGIDYRIVSDARAGRIRHDGRAVDDTDIANAACGAVACTLAPKQIYSNTQSLDLLYAPTDWLTLALTPTLVDKRLNLRTVEPVFLGGGIFQPATESLRQSKGGLGDTTVSALFDVFGDDNDEAHVGLGVSVPTGSSGERRSGSAEYSAYALQLGTGTWNLLPSAVYSGWSDRFFWGAAADARITFDALNREGYGVGNSYDATGWLGAQIWDWLGISVRATYDNRGGITGGFRNHLAPQLVGYRVVGTLDVPIYEYDATPQTVFGPMDMPSSIATHGWRGAIGANVKVPLGPAGDSRLRIEWSPSLTRSDSGFQLADRPSLTVAWSIDF